MTASHEAAQPYDLDAVCDALGQDARAGRLAHWGTSTLIDEFTGVPSIGTELFDALHRAAGITAEFPVGHAGVLHVYGYWFSDVPTPFGYKRDRWLDGALARALGASPTAFHLETTDGSTPLERVTRATLPVLNEPPAHAHVAEAALGRRRSRVVLVRAQDDGPHALIYGITAPGDVRPDAPLRLITAFPVDGDPAAVLDEFARTSGPRWNAVIEP